MTLISLIDSRGNSTSPHAGLNFNLNSRRSSHFHGILVALASHFHAVSSRPQIDGIPPLGDYRQAGEGGSDEIKSRKFSSLLGRRTKSKICFITKFIIEKSSIKSKMYHSPSFIHISKSCRKVFRHGALRSVRGAEQSEVND